MTTNMLTDGPSKGEVEALISISKGVLTPCHAASLLRRYDNNLQQAAVAVLDMPDVKSSNRTQTQRLPLNGDGNSQGEPITSPESKAPPIRPFKIIEVSPSEADDAFRWVDFQKWESQSNEDPDETLKTAHTQGKKISRLRIQHQDQDEINTDSAYTAVWHSNDLSDKQIASLQDQVEELWGRPEETMEKLERLVERME